MRLLEGLMVVLIDLAPMAVVLALTLLVVLFVRKGGRKTGALQRGSTFRRDVVTVVIVLLSAVPLLIALPVSENTRSSLFTLLGIAVTAVVSLGSSTFASNAMAGLMLRLIRNFKEGDYIRIGDYFGRVTERGLLHTEIQTEHSDLVTLPNLYMVTNPVRVIRPSGTFISTTLSLGYDIDNRTVEGLLLQAAKSLKLGSPFVRILRLGDFSVTYEISGKLTDTKRFLGARSALDRAVLDTLHGAGIEIVSPAFMNQRRILPDEAVIPSPRPTVDPPRRDGRDGDPDSKVFDKAEQVERLTEMKERMAELANEVGVLEKRVKEGDSGDREQLEETLAKKKQSLERLSRRLEALSDGVDGT